MATLQPLNLDGETLSVTDERYSKIHNNKFRGIVPYNNASYQLCKHIVIENRDLDRAKRYLRKISNLQRARICKAVQNSKYKRYFVDVKKKGTAFGVYFEPTSRYITTHRDEVKAFLSKVAKETNTLIC